MMIAPAPMMRMLLRSVRFGITPPAGPPQGRRAPPRGAVQRRSRKLGGSYLLFLHQRDETVEQVRDVVRAWGSFRVALEAEGGAVGAGQALQGAVEERDVRGTQVGRQGLLVDREAVVLAGDADAAVVE